MKKQKEGAADIYAVRRQKRLRKIVRRSVIFIVLAMLLLLVYQRRNSWIPKLETIGSKHQSGRNDGALSDGEFPLMVYGGNGYQSGTVDGSLLVLSDTYLHIYDTAGRLESARQHTYGSAMLKTAGDFALIYESGGTRFRLETAVNTRYEHTVPDSIIFGRVASDGKVLLVTASDECACKLLVFNEKGQQVYERSCVEDLVTVSFNSDSSGCYAVSLRVQNGIMKSVVHAYSFTEKADLWSSQPLDMLVISVYNTNEGDLFLLGDTACCYMADGGTVKNTYTYPDTLVQGDSAGSQAVLLLHNDEKRTDTVVIFNGDAGKPVTRTYDKTVKCVRMMPEDHSVIVQLRSEVQTLRADASVSKTAEITDSYDSFLKIGSYLFLNGYDRIDRLEYRN